MSVDQPFKLQRVRGLRRKETAGEFGARWHHGPPDRVEPELNRVITSTATGCGTTCSCAPSAPTRAGWRSREVLTYHDGRDGPDYRLLPHELREGRVHKVAFVKPSGPSWPLPLYDLG